MRGCQRITDIDDIDQAMCEIGLWWASDPVRPRSSRGTLVCGSPVIVDRALSPACTVFTGSLIPGMVRVLLDVGSHAMSPGSYWILDISGVVPDSGTSHAKLGSL